MTARKHTHFFGFIYVEKHPSFFVRIPRRQWHWSWVPISRALETDVPEVSVFLFATMCCARPDGQSYAAIVIWQDLSQIQPLCGGPACVECSSFNWRKLAEAYPSALNQQRLLFVWVLVHVQPRLWTHDVPRAMRPLTGLGRKKFEAGGCGRAQPVCWTWPWTG